MFRNLCWVCRYVCIFLKTEPCVSLLLCESLFLFHPTDSEFLWGSKKLFDLLDCESSHIHQDMKTDVKLEMLKIFTLNHNYEILSEN